MKKYLVFILLIIIFIGVAYFYLIFTPLESCPGKELQFSVKKGESSKIIAQNLEKEGLIRYSFVFRLYLLFTNTFNKLQAGEYLLSSCFNAPQITEKLIAGDTIRVTVTIPEGFTVKQIEQRIGKNLPEENLEGFLFPDTYHFSFDFSAEEAMRKMKDNFEKKISEDLREEIERQGKTLFEIITMASLIEKEVKVLEDKKTVSGILWKRLETGMLLQVDAAIAYLYQGESWDFNQMRREIALLRDVDSPYNTYKYLGLPPGPICNPGLESIKAAVYPKESDYWYYLSTEEGETVFSKTLEEHNLARVKYFK